MRAFCSGAGGPQTRWSGRRIIVATGTRSSHKGGTATASMGISTAALAGIVKQAMSSGSMVALMSLCCLAARPRSPLRHLQRRRHRRHRQPQFRPLDPHQSRPHSRQHQPSAALVREGGAVPPALRAGGAGRASPIAWLALGAGAAAPRQRLQHHRLRRLRLQAQACAATIRDAREIALQADGVVGVRLIVLVAGETGAAQHQRLCPTPRRSN